MTEFRSEGRETCRWSISGTSSLSNRGAHPGRLSWASYLSKTSRGFRMASSRRGRAIGWKTSSLSVTPGGTRRRLLLTRAQGPGHVRSRSRRAVIHAGPSSAWMLDLPLPPSPPLHTHALSLSSAEISSRSYHLGVFFWLAWMSPGPSDPCLSIVPSILPFHFCSATYTHK